MSEPRKLHTGSAYGTQNTAGNPSADVNFTGSLDQEQFAAARLRARQQAAQNQTGRRRVLQQPVRSAQGRHIRASQANAAAQADAARQAALAAKEAARQASLREQQPAGEMTRAQQQAMAYRAATERKYGDTARFTAPRTRQIQQAQQGQYAARQAARQQRTANVQQLDLNSARSAHNAYDYDADSVPVQRGGIRMGGVATHQTTQPAQHRVQSQGVGREVYHSGKNVGRKPLHDAAAKNKKSAKKSGTKKKKFQWWKILLITLLVIALIFGGAYMLIANAIAPGGGAIKLSQLINTPKEYQGKELNLLVVGIDRSGQSDTRAGAAVDSNANDGLTDMILYVHFNNETGELKMLQIPRDTMVTTDTSFSSNYRINGIAKTQGSDGYNNMAALCDSVYDQFKLPIDGYVVIRLEMLLELVDTFGGIEIYVPQDIDYTKVEGGGDSILHEGYQTLSGEQMEFLLRARKVYSDGDIGRLNMQRQFYAALFRRVKSINNVWDVASLTPAVLNYMETDMSVSDLISFAVSMLKIDSSKIMIAQLPVISGPLYNEQSVLYAARQEDADLLNTYFRENTGAVDASELNLCDNVFDLSGYTATDPNIQFMGTLMSAADDAQKNENLDGSNQVVDIIANDENTTTESDAASTESVA